MIDNILRKIKKIIPHKVFAFFQPVYHYTLAFLGAIYYRFPSRAITVIAITGTKGKTTTAEFINAILEADGKKTALSSTLRFKIGDTSRPNMYKMSLPGRFFLQRFLREAVDARCTHAIIEITSEAAKQYRHKFVSLDALLFTNLAPEHIESHGSFEKYAEAKLSIGRALVTSHKRPRIMVVNGDDSYGERFLSLGADINIPYHMTDATSVEDSAHGVSFVSQHTRFSLAILGHFNIANALATISYARAIGITDETIARGLGAMTGVRGRMEHIEAGQNFSVIVDYAHTPESLESAYSAYPRARKICVLGSTGGGRDTWKRPRMGEIADTHCAHIILTDEDPYDENPDTIVADVRTGITHTPCEIIMDRRAAIAHACKLARQGDVVYITGKGTDPYIMGKNGTKTPWDDASVAREEIVSLLHTR